MLIRQAGRERKREREEEERERKVKLGLQHYPAKIPENYDGFGSLFYPRRILPTSHSVR